MRIHRASLLLAMPVWASAWSPMPPSMISLRTATRSSSDMLTLRATVENVAADGSMTSASDGDSTTTTTVLKPEYEAALSMIQSTLYSKIPEKYHDKMCPLLLHFAREYMTACQTSAMHGERNVETCRPEAVVQRYLGAIQLALQLGMPGPNKFEFGTFHKAMRGDDAANGKAMNLAKFGTDFFGPAINMEKSAVLGMENIEQVVEQLKQGHNVVMFANHQTEGDPQVVSLLFEEKTPYGKEFMDMIFVAGHKVTTDPLAVPFSMGCNLICIHSKKHIDADPAAKAEKQKQNLKAMQALLKLFSQGGTLLWVAPSGGRDRRDLETREVPIAPFDSKTIDMFRLIGNKSKRPTHYYTMAMISYDMCPPPDFIDPGVGELRNMRFVPCGIAVGKELQSVGGLESRNSFRSTAFEQCQQDYQKLRKAIE